MAGLVGSFLVFDTTRLWGRWPRQMQWAALTGVAGLVAASLAGQWHWQFGALKASQAQLQTLQARLNEAASQPSESLAGTQTAITTSAAEKLNPAQWPEATEALDAWVRDAAQAAAAANGVSLQQLTITRPDAAPRAGEPARPPHALLKINARGAYPALKAWQAQMQALMPSLGVESLRWQAPPNDGTGQLMAEWTWRLWVRPADAQPLPGPADAAATPATWRPALQASTRDPFGMAPPPAPPAPPVARVVEPPPVSAPVMPVAPPLQWTTIGRLRGLDGRWRLSGHWGQPNETVSLAEGDLSPAGHQVLRITNTMMELQHLETKERLSFRLPPPPRFETR